MSLTPTKGVASDMPSGQRTPGTIADEFSKMDFPTPSGFSFPVNPRAKGHLPKSLSISGGHVAPLPGGAKEPVGDDEHDSDDVTEQLSALPLPEPEYLTQAATTKRRESVSDQLAVRLSTMDLPEPSRIYGGPGSNQTESKGGVKPEDWYNLKLAAGEEIPEAVRKGSIAQLSSPPTSPSMGKGDGKGHNRGAPSLSSLLELDESKKSGILPSVVEAAKTATSAISGAAQSASAAAIGAVSAAAVATGLSAGSGEVEKSAAAAQVVTPWDVQGEIGEDGKAKEVDYNALIKDFGTKAIDADLLARFEKLTGHKAHRLLRRGTFFSHRDLNMILDRYEQGKPFYLYTGRGPSSSSMHMGHQIPFMFTKWLQEVFDCPLVIQLTEDEKFLFKPELKLEEVHAFAYDNIKDIIACGFNLKKTFIFSDLDYVGGAFYWNIVRIARAIPTAQSKGAFGFTDTDNVGKLHFVAVQAAPSFSNSFPQIFGQDSSAPCLIPCAIDQDPYFRITRDVAVKLKYPKPALIHCKFLPALQGAATKMSASNPNSAIYMSDTPGQIKNKVNRHAFSGGGDTEELHRKNGGNPDVDVAFQYLSFYEEDDEKLAKIAAEYRAGTLLTGQLKALCIKALQDEVKAFQDRKAAVTEELFLSFMDPKRPIDPTPSPRAS